MEIFARAIAIVAAAWVIYVLYIVLPWLSGWTPADIQAACSNHGRIQQVVDVSSPFSSIEHGDQVVVLCTDGAVVGVK